MKTLSSAIVLGFLLSALGCGLESETEPIDRAAQSLGALDSPAVNVAQLDGSQPGESTPLAGILEARAGLTRNTDTGSANTVPALPAEPALSLLDEVQAEQTPDMAQRLAQ